MAGENPEHQKIKKKSNRFSKASSPSPTLSAVLSKDTGGIF